MYKVEIAKLTEGLTERGIAFNLRPLFDGWQIICDEWDAVCHMGLYGHNLGLLEIMGSIVENEYDEVEGYLTVSDILKRV